MKELIEMTELAVRVLRSNPDAPAVDQVRVRGSHHTGQVLSFELVRELKLRDVVLAIAAWAVALDTTVTVVDLRTYGAVEIGAYTEIDGRKVRVTTALCQENLDLLMALTGAERGQETVSFNPVALQTMFSVTAVTV